MSYYVAEYGRLYPDSRYVDLIPTVTAARVQMRREARAAATACRRRFGRAWVQVVGPDHRIVRVGSRMGGTRCDVWTTFSVKTW